MSLPQYPAELPPPELDGYRLQPVSPFVRTELASGRARQRRRFTSTPTMIPVSWLLSLIEFELFEAWFRHTITDGADWFTGPLKTSRGIRDDYEQRFADMYEAREVGPMYWRVSARLELRDRHTASAAEAEFPLEIIYSSLFDKTMNRHWPDA